MKHINVCTRRGLVIAGGMITALTTTGAQEALPALPTGRPPSLFQQNAQELKAELKKHTPYRDAPSDQPSHDASPARLEGIILLDDQHWCLRIGGQSLTPQTLPSGATVRATGPDCISLELDRHTRWTLCVGQPIPKDPRFWALLPRPPAPTTEESTPEQESEPSEKF